MSISPSASPSPSPGWERYTKGDYANLPASDDSLENNYSAQDYLDVDAKDDVRVDQTATEEYPIHQFKDYVGTANACSLEWEGQTSLACSSSAVVLEIYNINTNEWELVDSDNTTDADTDFVLTGNILDLSDYKEGEVITCRVYQQAI